MKDMYGLSYLLFKHGSMAHRRLDTVLKEFLYRTILTMLIQLAFYVLSGFSTVLPYGSFFFATFMVVLTPIQYFLEGILHVEYGYGILHRIFGEYKFNQIHSVSVLNFSGVVASAFFDALIFLIFPIVETVQMPDMLVEEQSGKTVAWTSRIVMNAILLSIFQSWRNRSIYAETNLQRTLNIIMFLITLGFVMGDEHLAGIKAVLASPNLLLTIVFVAILLSLKMFLRLAYQILSQSKQWKDRMNYQMIEDRLFMEEFEDPDQHFNIADFDNYPDLLGQLEKSKMLAINQNLLRVHRTDSMDAILERINVSGGQAEGRNNLTNISMINKFNLKLNDLSKETEYSEASITNRQLSNYERMIWTSVVLHLAVAIFKIANTFMQG